MLSALARPLDERAVADAISRRRAPLGVRVGRLGATSSSGTSARVDVDGRRVRVKIGRLDGRVVNVAPEHDDCAAIARRPAGR